MTLVLIIQLSQIKIPIIKNMNPKKYLFSKIVEWPRIFLVSKSMSRMSTQICINSILLNLHGSLKACLMMNVFFPLL